MYRKKPVIITNVLIQQVNLRVKNTIVTLNCSGFIPYNFQMFGALNSRTKEPLNVIFKTHLLKQKRDSERQFKLVESQNSSIVYENYSFKNF